MTPPKEVVNLVERFDLHRDAYKSGKYKETQLRREFIDPFFKALGWDVENKEGRAEAYKDVIHEDAIKIGGATKAPDYCFRIGGSRKFFLEAKEPSINIEETPRTAYQLRRYAWSAKLPLSILTDFEEFAVYDCRTRPVKDDKASTARVMYLTYDQYIARWDEIESIFSRDAVLKGAYDKYVESSKKKRGTEEVDDAFLKEIEKWRDLLARNIALRNPKLSQHELNFAVQRTIDRIIFLRICEDRSIEDYNHLMGICNGANIYKRLCEYFYHADERYNSGLFHFQKEKGRPGYDELTPHLKIDDAALKKIIGSLYYPDSPYEFSILPASILGQVYEQFLGKVIHLTAGHRAKIEEKPEVKKAGGVYYTPEYIVDYIVDNTLVKMLEGKKPKQVEKIKILDPACGSGSFLINAYQKLIDWHRDYYEESKDKKHKALIYEAPGGEMKLVTTEKKRILLNNIYGVDIDSQAVEVTKLSLLLKVLEGETDQTINAQLKLFHERALPDLADNIKCGNSLIGPDFYDGQQMSLLEDDEVRRINVFDWRAEFSDIMKVGGFDAVIGNPPYLYSAGQKYEKYFGERYKLSQYQTDYYVYFLEKAIHLAKRLAKVAFIISDSWLNSESFSIFRNHLLAEHSIDGICVFDYPVFKNVTLENSILVLSVFKPSREFPIISFISPEVYSEVNKIEPKNAISLGIINPRYSVFSDRIIEKIENGSNRLDVSMKLNRGIHAYRVDGYGKSKYVDGPQTKRDKETASYHADRALDESYLPETKGRNVHRFSFKHNGKYLSYGPWLAEPREPYFFFDPKIVLRKILGHKLSGAFIDKPYAIDQSLYILISIKRDQAELKHSLGILLSSLAAWYLRTKYSIFDTLYPWYTKKQLAAFPMKEVDSTLVNKVEQISELQKKLAESQTPHEKDFLKRQIDATDRQIDQLVYELYGLTEEEIMIVEGKPNE